MAYTKFTKVEADEFKGDVSGNLSGDLSGNVLFAYKSVALTDDATVTENFVALSSVTATKILTVNVPKGAMFVVKNGDANNDVTVKCSATDTGARLAKSTTGIYVNVDGDATLIK